MRDLTRAEAIELLDGDWDFWEEFVSPKGIEALKLAIDSLKTDEAYQIEYENRDFIEIPEGATNGQMFCRLFRPYGLKENGSCVWVWLTESDETHYTLPKDWWNTPYRKEQE